MCGADAGWHNNHGALARRMSQTCPRCGADNRASAKFCLKCAQQLVPLAQAPDDAKTERKRRRKKAAAAARRATRRAAPPQPRRPGIATAIGCSMVLGWLAWWWLTPSASLPRQPVAQAEASTTTATDPPAATMAVLPASTPIPPAVESAQRVAADAQTPTDVAPHARAPAASSAEPSQPPVPSAAAPAHAATSRGTPKTRVSRPSGNTTQRPPIASEAPPPQTAPSPSPSVAQSALCADRQFIAHSICLQAECSKPALHQHPQCVRMREQQEGMQRGSGDR